jgi:hypothetical protein
MNQVKPNAILPKEAFGSATALGLLGAICSITDPSSAALAYLAREMQCRLLLAVSV